MLSDQVRIARDGPLAVLRLDRTERRNALSLSMWHAIRDHLTRIAAAPPRVLLVCGSGGHFSSGMDLYPDNPLAARLLPAVVGGDEAAIAALIEEIKAVTAALAHLDCVTIAAVEGVCYAAGLELALACDLRVAARTARFAMQEVRFGMAPDLGGTVRLARLVGRARATDLILTTRAIDGAEAVRIGLADRLAEEGEALGNAELLARTILDNAPTAVREVLRVLRAVETSSDEHAFALETAAGVRTLASGEVVKGIEAFAMKMTPSWETR